MKQIKGDKSMTRLSASFFAILIGAGPALAEAHMDRANMIRSRDITGGVVYSMADSSTWGDGAMYDTVDTNWNDIGEIEDVILDRNGQMIGVVGEIGGFLDIGDKHVFIKIDNVRLVPTDDKTYAVVTNLSEEQLEELPGIDEGFWN